MATFSERAAHLVNHVFSFYLLSLFVILVVSHFDFEGGTLVLIASVPGQYHLSLVAFVSAKEWYNLCPEQYCHNFSSGLMQRRINVNVNFVMGRLVTVTTI